MLMDQKMTPKYLFVVTRTSTSTTDKFNNIDQLTQILMQNLK